jgi:hypothetical protein
MQVLLIMYKLEQCDFTSVHLTNLDWFQLIAFTLMSIAYLPNKRDKEWRE